MNKKYGFVFLGLGVILIILFLVFNSMNVFKNSNPSPDPGTNEPVEEKVNPYFIKSHDTLSKTKVTFPMFDGLTANTDSISEFDKEFYSNEDNVAYTAMIIETDKSLEEYGNYEIDVFKGMFNSNNGYDLKISDVNCKYICRKFLISKDNQIQQEVFNVYVKSSNQDIAKISYLKKGDNVSTMVINEIINNISITNDAA